MRHQAPFPSARGVALLPPLMRVERARERKRERSCALVYIRRDPRVDIVHAETDLGKITSARRKSGNRETAVITGGKDRLRKWRGEMVSEGGLRPADLD